MRLGVSHIARRGFLLGCALLLAGCAQPQLTGDIQGGLAISSVRVETSSLSKAVKGRPNAISTSQLASDATRVLTQRFASKSGAVRGDLVVEVKEVNLVARGLSALAPVQSTSKVVLSVKERGTGKVIVAPTEITAPSAQLRGSGIIGAATAPSVEKDYNATLRGLANAVEKRLYGAQK